MKTTTLTATLRLCLRLPRTRARPALRPHPARTSRSPCSQLSTTATVQSAKRIYPTGHPHPRPHQLSNNNTNHNSSKFAHNSTHRVNSHLATIGTETETGSGIQKEETIETEIGSEQTEREVGSGNRETEVAETVVVVGMTDTETSVEIREEETEESGRGNRDMADLRTGTET